MLSLTDFTDLDSALDTSIIILMQLLVYQGKLNSLQADYFLLADFRNELAVIIEWLRCSKRIHKILCSNFSITIHGMILDKSLTAKLSEITHSYCASVGTLDGKVVDTAACKEKNTMETSCVWTLIIIIAGPYGR